MSCSQSHVTTTTDTPYPRNFLEAIQQARRIPPQPIPSPTPPQPQLYPYYTPPPILQLTPATPCQQNQSQSLSFSFHSEKSPAYHYQPVPPLRRPLASPPQPQFYAPSRYPPIPAQHLFLPDRTATPFLKLQPHHLHGYMLPNSSQNASPHLPSNDSLYPESTALSAIVKSPSPSFLGSGSESEFVRNSFSDIPLGGLEEQLARVSTNDTYFGPIRLRVRQKDTRGNSSRENGDDPVQLEEEEDDEDDDSCGAGCGDSDGRPSSECQEDPLRQVPYSTSSVAFVPPGVIMVNEVWSLFAKEKISFCNGFINTMDFDRLQHCLRAHNLNQLGSVPVLRKRLQEFLRRLRDSPSTGRSGSNVDGFDNFPQLQGTPISDGVNSESLIKLNQLFVLTPDSFYDFLLFIDLEATCEKHVRTSDCEFPHEIIEFPVLLYDTRQRKCVGVFHSFCRPVRRPQLSAFCKQLTQIKQTQVDAAVEFPRLLRQLEDWLLVKNSLADKRCAIVCDCSADMGKFMRKQCQLSQQRLPEWASLWINLSHAFHNFYRFPPRHKSNLKTMLADLDLSFVGQHHSGLDDAMNILRVAQIMLADGCQLRVNQRLDPAKAPSYAMTLPRSVANSVCGGVMGCQLELLKKRSKSSYSFVRSGYTPPLANTSTTGTAGGASVSQQETNSSSISKEATESLLLLHSIQKGRVNGMKF